jgi:hypothetical protein
MRSLKQLGRRAYLRLSGAYTRRYSHFTRNLPPHIGGFLDWHLLPKAQKYYGALDHDWLPRFRDSLGGPFNGQEGRIQVFQEILKSFDFQAIVETGTFQGTTTLFLRRTSRLPVFTVEAVPRTFYFAMQRLKSDRDIHQDVGDSRQFLEKLGRDWKLGGKVFFYLDAHWKEDLPLFEELQIISKFWKDPVIMIDDFEVPDDPEYGWDDYGPGKQLSVGCMPADIMREYCLFWPSLRGKEESGLRRGCVVMSRRGAAAEKLADLPVLRSHDVVKECR